MSLLPNSQAIPDQFLQSIGLETFHTNPRNLTISYDISTFWENYAGNLQNDHILQQISPSNEIIDVIHELSSILLEDPVRSHLQRFFHAEQLLLFGLIVEEFGKVNLTHTLCPTHTFYSCPTCRSTQFGLKENEDEDKVHPIIHTKSTSIQTHRAVWCQNCHSQFTIRDLTQHDWNRQSIDSLVAGLEQSAAYLVPLVRQRGFS
ncbi:hypothetical protein BLNAU_9180 [Blattamonas nauphoetae]|uniref:Uncharacterized protein n=1 Tax=Blattamonas nauphoetae TaxID=2049346 RepID=A0ABQ9XWF6_9EUKA|nr:hypothetical protein BLNAU_9180 [Blattamonas nauphoetae]